MGKAEQRERKRDYVKESTHKVDDGRERERERGRE